MSKLSFIITAACLLACGKDTTTTTSASGNAAAPVAAKPTTKVVDLAPLPLTLTMPAEETAITMDMSMDEHKSVSVSYDAVSAGINVSMPSEKTFAELKKGNKGDTILFPFKRWVKEDKSTAIEEFNSDGKTGYLALAWKEIGGKTYVCKSNGLSGLKSTDDAEKVLKTCDTLAAK